MNRKRALLAAIVAAIGIGVSTGATALPANAWFDVARGAGTYMYNGGPLFVSVDAGMDANMFSQGQTETFVCAMMGRTIKSSRGKGGSVDVGCSRLPVVVDPALRTAHVDGTIRSRYVDVRNGKQVSWSTLHVDITWTGSGLPTPYVGNNEESAIWGASPYAFLDLGTGMVRGAQASGSVTSARLGRLSSVTTDAILFEATDVTMAENV